MYQKILVPLDGSPFSEEVLPLAIGVAQRTGAELRLIHVMESILSHTIESEDIVREELLELAGEIRGETGVAADAVVIMGEETVPVLCDEIEGRGVDLVVMATHGWGGLRRAWLGSVTDSLVRAAEVPVLAVRPRGGEPKAEPPEGTPAGQLRPPLHAAEIEHALITLDGSELAEAALEPLIALAGPETRYTLLRTVMIPIPGDAMTPAWDPGLWQDLLPTLRNEAEEYLAGVAERLEGRVREVRTIVPVEFSAASAIIEYAAHNEVDLIAMATHGRSGFRRMALGSVTDKVLRAADAPVLIVRPIVPPEE